ncbi:MULTISPECIES: hypothetical protein [unclassified Ectothiorhodospira]|uniref:hypothetical protein n=1 Tax=unclassified Ectothiorhodospira TaxID=2684909 RepID=UPI001EE96872|nr:MULTISPECIES: hypothetical protein [unclassified Ectothiorhodospira]MCG5515040.1 hypothetical protein [Ectothiorhodospira sp. 9100]MCG5517637.1 hypothetical protein [Ectothiorhodospira sp. 9905]
MKFETFEAGRWVPQYQYKSFSPVTVNHEWSWDDAQITRLACKAQGPELTQASSCVKDMALSLHIGLLV